MKDLHFLRGRPVRLGSRAYQWLWSPVDDTLVKGLKRAGFVILGKTATSELALLPIVETDLHPPTRNAWNPERTAGGFDNTAFWTRGGLAYTMTPEELQQAEQQAKMDPAMQQVVGVRNNVGEMDVDIVLDDVPASAAMQSEQFEALVQIAPQAAAMPPPLFKALVQASSLRNKDELLKSLEGKGEQNPQLMQMQQQMQQMQQALQQAQAAANDKSAEQQLKMRELEIKAAELDLKRQEAQAKSQQAMMQADPAMTAMKSELERAALELEYERKLFEAQKRIAILEVEKAETSMTVAAQQMQQAQGDLAQAAADAQATAGVETIPA